MISDQNCTALEISVARIQDFSLCKYFIEPVKSWSVESFKSYTQTKP